MLPDHRWVSAAYFMLPSIVKTFDWILTAQIVNSGMGVEVNPVVLFLIGIMGETPAYLSGVALMFFFGALILICHNRSTPKERRVVQICWIIPIVGSAVPVVNNIGLMLNA